MRKTSLLSAGLVAGLLALNAFAQPASGGGPAANAPPDCSKAKDPARCEARQKARDACKAIKGLDYKTCIHDHMPAADCSKARDPQRCEARQQAHEACKGKYGAERRQCMREQKQARK